MSQGWLKYESKGVMRFTEKGQEELKDLLLCGCTTEEIADYFCISVDQVEELTGPGGQCHELRRWCTADLKRRVRKMQLAVGADNAAAAKLLGMHILGQPREPAPSMQDKIQRVIDGMPDLDKTPEEWLHQFGPQDGPAPTVTEQLRKIRDGQADS